MIKKLLNLNEKEKIVFDASARPFIIYCIIIGIIVIVGSSGTLSPDAINGYFDSMILYMLVNYINLTYMNIKGVF